MNIGEFKHRVIIQRYEEEEDRLGISRGEWKDLKTVWCKINNLFGKEYWTAKEYGGENTVEFIIRYSACPGVSVKDRLKYKDRLFNIEFVDNVLYRGELLKIKAVEVTS